MSRGAGSEGAGTRLILYVGKGGVGKTTMAAATAARAAELGHRTLVVSTDIAHSLGDVLGAELGADPTVVGDLLWAQEINVLAEVHRQWGRVQDQLAAFVRKEGFTDLQSDELAIVPGMDEVAALIQIGHSVQSGDYDCIVVDAAPTGETIRLLSMPDSFQWFVSRLDEWRGRVMRTLSPFLRGMIPEPAIVEVMNRLVERVRGLRTILIDPQRSSYRIVLTPDRMVLREARRAETYLSLFDYPIDAVFLNRLLRTSGTSGSLGPLEGGYLGELARRQAEIIPEIHDTFSTLPIFEAALQTEEPIGLVALTALAHEIFGAQDPTAVLHTGRTQQVVQRDGTYVLEIPMPNVEIERLALTKRGDELYVEVGNFRRGITLPWTLAVREPGIARLRAGVLEIPFDPAPEVS